MTVTEALKILQRASREQPRFETFLACGFTPLHLQMFLNARLQEKRTGRFVEVKTGLYGNLAAGLEALGDAGLDAGLEAAGLDAGLDGIACAIEWPDLDPRFSYREAGSWKPAAVAEMVTGTSAALGRICAAIGRLPAGVRVAVSLPTLPFPPLFHTSGWQASQEELAIDRSVADFAANLLERRGTVVVNARRLGEMSPPGERLDLKSDLATGLPYSLTHADTLARMFAELLVPSAPKKGIITDLDDTLWHGIAGEAGPDGVSWDLASHQQAHGLYQKLLASLAEAGILIAIASKNDPAVVEKALRRTDLLLNPNRIFPLEVHWDAKSGSVERILRAWNISADSVIFVDDSPMELAEAKAAHPDLTCLQFPVNQPRGVVDFLRTLRDLCGKEALSEDDAIRLDSIRRGAAFQRESAAVATPEDFLRAADATIHVEFDTGSNIASSDARVLELVNKTNQFNINGARYTEIEWRKKLARPGALLLVVSYSDKFGPLGKIGVIQGCLDRNVLIIDTWVMSCRAFARRIEYRCLRLLFERYAVEQIEVQFAPTAKNGPARDFLAALCGVKPQGAVRLTGAQLKEKCPPLYHHIVEMERVETNG